VLRLGIVGLPNVGKSTLFNALTSSKAAAAENYPFCTVEPNVGVVLVPEPRLERLNELVQPKKKVPAVVEFVDIAGLVKGASQGEGLGNQFLSHIREVDAVVHVIRCFDDPDVVHVMGPVDRCATTTSSRASWRSPTSPWWSGAWRKRGRPRARVIRTPRPSCWCSSA